VPCIWALARTLPKALKDQKWTDRRQIIQISCKSSSTKEELHSSEQTSRFLISNREGKSLHMN
jgi:hypothetical protein